MAPTPSSDSATTVRVSSPLNPSSSPSPMNRPRGHSTSTIRELPPSATGGSMSPLARVTSSPSAAAIASLQDDSESSTFRRRSRSRSPHPYPFDESVWKKSAASGSPSPPDSSTSAVWKPGEMQAMIRPWRDPPKRKNTVPAEQTEGWEVTRERVYTAARAILGTSADIAHEVLVTSVDLLGLVPVPGLEPAARTLLQIWDCMQLVDMNRLQCLRLTERCADILISVRQEIKDAGDMVGEELALPIAKLTEIFSNVLTFLQRQIHRPFLKRYLKRDEILRQIQGCDAQLGEALGMFGLSIQIRILKQIQQAEKRRQEETKLLLDAISRSRSSSLSSGNTADGNNALQLQPGRNSSSSTRLDDSTSTILPSVPVPFLPPSQQELAPPPPYMSPTTTITPPTPVTPPAPAMEASETVTPRLPAAAAAAAAAEDVSVPPGSPTRILDSLMTLRGRQNAEDLSKDIADLRSLMRNALAASSDAEMLSVLGVKRDEMPEAIKTLQRELERCLSEEKEREMMAKDGWERVPATPLPTPVEEEEDLTMQGASGKKTTRRGLVKMVRRLSVQSGVRKGKERAETESLQRSHTVTSAFTSSTSSGERDGKRRSPTRDTLDREFIEGGIDALRRMSRGAEVNLNLPWWTITRYEVDRELKIGIGFFSDVYRGTWRGRTVAIKVLADTTPRNLFVREVEIWKALRHPNVLELYGASSATSDPPWFFVSPYLKNGSLTEFLRKQPASVMFAVSGDGRFRTGSLPSWSAGLVAGSRESWPNSNSRRERESSMGNIATGTRGRSPSIGGEVAREWDLPRYMHEIAKGMDYLHSQGVLHGDLKASNVLVTDRYHCQITDFGQSEMKSEAYRISGTQPPHGTLRWQAPELMRGTSQLTTEMDVYSFGIVCAEILSMGRMPWPLMDDDTVRHFVLHEDTRPAIPQTRFSTPALQELLRICWEQDPPLRPPFSKVVMEFQQLRKNGGTAEQPVDVPSPRNPQLEDYVLESRPSPDMRPTGLPAFGSSPPLGDFRPGTSPGSDVASFRTARDTSQSPPLPSLLSFPEERASTTTRVHMPEPVFFNPSGPPSSRTSSIFTSSRAPTEAEEGYAAGADSAEYTGYDSPPPADERIAEMRNERRYRMLLVHEFHPSLTLPLWSPTPVEVGAVGYLSKPKGQFITLFNSRQPNKASMEEVRALPSIEGFGNVKVGQYKQDRRNVALRSLDAISGLTSKLRSPGSPSKFVLRRFSYPLRAGHKTAYLYTESTTYNYMDKLEAPKTWFKSNVDTILKLYEAQHHITKEDLFLVIGTLDTQDYGLFVSHNHPDGQVHFNVYAGPSKGQPWGKFTTDTEVSEFGGVGPVYDEPVLGDALTANKVSSAGAGRSTVLLARLRFKPDVLEPTSL